MTEKLSMLFRAQIIAGSQPSLSPSGIRYKRLVAAAEQQLNEAVDQALADNTEMMKR